MTQQNQPIQATEFVEFFLSVQPTVLGLPKGPMISQTVLKARIKAHSSPNDRHELARKNNLEKFDRFTLTNVSGQVYFDSEIHTNEAIEKEISSYKLKK